MAIKIEKKIVKYGVIKEGEKADSSAASHKRRQRRYYQCHSYA